MFLESVTGAERPLPRPETPAVRGATGAWLIRRRLYGASL
jgi:hypothetical protein